VTVSRTGRLLRQVVRAACASPVLTVALAVLLAAVSVWFAVTHLTFATSNRALLPQDQPYIERYVEYDREFGDLDDLVIVVEARSLPEAKVYANRLVRELRARKLPLGQVAYRIDPKQFEGRALLYLSTEKLSEIRDRIFDYQTFMETFSARPTLDQLVDGLATEIAGAFVTGFFDLGLDQAKGGNDLRFIEDLVAQVSARVDRPVAYHSPWGAFFSASGGDETSAGYFLSDDQRLLFILADPESQEGSFTGDRLAIDGTRAVVADLRREFPQIQVGVTGKPALSSDEMVAAFGDSQKATVIAFALTLALMMVAFLRIGQPVIMLLVLAVTLCWSIGLATLTVGHLSLFSVMFISIVIGIGIDYGIYFLFRYDEERFLGRDVREAIEVTAMRSGPGTLLGAVTAAGAFYVLAFTDFRGLQELGIIASSAILLSWLGMITVYPATLVLAEGRRGTQAGRVPRAIELERIRVPFLDLVTAHPKTVLVLAGLLTLASGYGLRWLRFDYNLLNLQAHGTESVVWEKRIIATAGRSGFSALASARSLEELRQMHHAFARLPSVSEVDDALLLIPEDQEAKRKIISDFASIVAPVRINRPLPMDVDRLLGAFQTLKRRIDIASNEAPAGETKTRLAKLDGDIDALIRKIRQTDRDAVEAALGHLQQQLYRDFVRSFQRLQANLAPKQVGMADLPVEIRRKFVSDGGRFLLQIHPAVDIWGREGAQKFVEELRTVDPDVTGTPVITYEAIRLMERAYKQGTLYAVILVAVITGLTIRRWRETLLALLPLGLGIMWTFGLMYFFSLKLTLGNVFGIPLILGAAAEFGSNIVLRFMEGQAHGGPLIARSTVMAVLVNGLTTIVGFGSLMIANHRGVFGLGLLLTLGMVTSLIAGLAVLPVMLRMVERMRAARRERRARQRIAAAQAGETRAPLEGAERSSS
jgi:hopanoid biosynthesis associated RND transporter like protein HpnN